MRRIAIALALALVVMSQAAAQSEAVCHRTVENFNWAEAAAFLKRCPNLANGQRRAGTDCCSIL
jgi:hypothetical protein